ncbi:MAG: ABC transporter permease [Candidatus Caenarcaniphilales bacterium]|nr:ABC transporter permease [Candidatus Caenarcaniphilales bacterium]
MTDTERLSPSHRLLDSLSILLGVTLLTFLVVRLDLKIEELDLLIAGTILLCSWLMLSFAFTRQILVWLGIIMMIALIACAIPILQFLFPTLLDSSLKGLGWCWGYIVLPLLWCSILGAFAWRSWTSKSRIFFHMIGLVGLSLILQTGSSYWGNPGGWLKVKLSTPLVLKAGDPLADLRMNPSVHPEALKREERRLGLDQPLWRQYLLWLDGIILRGDFGLTQQGISVLETIKVPLRNTLLLNIIVVLLSWLVSIPLGMIAATNQARWLDALILRLSSISLSTPSFLLTIFILGFGIKLGIGKIGGLTSLNYLELDPWQKFLDLANHLILPVSILTFVSIGGLIRQMRANLLDVLNEDYIKAARARGLSERQVFWGHAFQNAINPLVTLLGFEFAALVSGAALTEVILAYPGIGALTLEAAQKLDINLIMFNLLIGTLMLLAGNALADWLLRLVDPRIKG